MSRAGTLCALSGSTGSVRTKSRWRRGTASTFAGAVVAARRTCRSCATTPPACRRLSWWSPRCPRRCYWLCSCSTCRDAAAVSCSCPGGRRSSSVRSLRSRWNSRQNGRHSRRFGLLWWMLATSRQTSPVSPAPAHTRRCPCPGKCCANSTISSSCVCVSRWSVWTSPLMWTRPIWVSVASAGRSNWW